MTRLLKRRFPMKKIVLAAVAAATLVLTAAPTFANEGISSQSANIAAGGGAYPEGIIPMRTDAAGRVLGGV
jgi:hypothetical protein